MNRNHIVSARLKEIRTQRDLTQANVADGIGVSRSAVASWETGVREPNGAEMRRICEFLSVSSDYIYGYTNTCNTIKIPKVYNIDFNKLNALGKRTLFEYYNFLAQNETYAK